MHLMDEYPEKYSVQIGARCIFEWSIGATSGQLGFNLYAFENSVSLSVICERETIIINFFVF